MQRLDLPRGTMGVQPKRLSRPTAAGIDVRFSSWDCILGEVVRSPLSPTGVVRPVFVGKLRDEKEVDWVLEQYNCRFAVIDTRPEAHLAIRIQQDLLKRGVQTWRAQYNTVPGTVKVQENSIERLLTLDRTLVIDDVHHAFTAGLGVQLPQNFREITGGNFVSEMTSSTRVPMRHSGRDCYDWVKGGPDHSLHAFSYLLAAIARSNLLWGDDVTSLMPSRGAVATGRTAEAAGMESGASSESAKVQLDFEAIENQDDLGSDWAGFE